MTQNTTRQLPKPQRNVNGSDYYAPIWVTVGAKRKGADDNGDQKFGLSVDGPKDGWWSFRKDQLDHVTPGANLQVELKTKPNKDRTGFYQDVVSITAVVNDDNEIVLLAPGILIAQETATQTPVDPALEGWRPGMDEPVEYERETYQEVVKDVAEARQTHRPRTGADWQDEPPSFHTWKERGIQKMSALKAAVEWLNAAPERLREFGDDEALRGVYGGRISEVEDLTWRLMRELADGEAVDHVSE